MHIGNSSKNDIGRSNLTLFFVSIMADSMYRDPGSDYKKILSHSYTVVFERYLRIKYLTTIYMCHNIIYIIRQKYRKMYSVGDQAIDVNALQLLMAANVEDQRN